MDSSLYNQLNSLIASYSQFDEFNFYFLGICKEYSPKDASLESICIQLSTNFSNLSKDSLIKLIHETKTQSIDKNDFQDLQDLFSFLKSKENLKDLFKDFEILPLLFPKLSKFQWFYLGTFMAHNPTFEFKSFLEKISIYLFAYAYKNINEHEKTNLLALLLEEELKSEVKEGHEEEKANHKNPSVAPVKRPKCLICFDPISKWSAAKTTLTRCQHSFHFNCLKEYLETMINEKIFPVKCPMENCLVELLESDISNNLGETYLGKFHSFTLKRFLETHRNEVVCCPSPNCEYFEFLGASKCQRFYCRKCNKEFCMKCREDWHDRMSCGEQGEQATFAKIASKNGYRRCPACKMYIEKNGGCGAMICRCSHRFSWF